MDRYLYNKIIKQCIGMVSTKFRIEGSLQEKGEVGLEKDTWELELYQLCFVSCSLVGT